MTGPLTQVGGNHYAKMGMQPFTFTMANRYDPCAHSVLKYVARHKDKDGAEGLKKARHCVQIRHDEITARPEFHPSRWAANDMILIETFITVNRIEDPEAQILRVLHALVTGRLEDPRGEVTGGLIVAISDLIALRYPGTAL